MLYNTAPGTRNPQLCIQLSTHTHKVIKI